MLVVRHATQWSDAQAHSALLRARLQTHRLVNMLVVRHATQWSGAPAHSAPLRARLWTPRL